MSGLTGFMCPNLSSPTISDVHKINQRKLFCQFSNQLCDQNKKGTIDRPFICCATELIFKHTFLTYGINIFISFCMPCSGLDVVSSYWYMYSMIIMSVSDEGYYRNESWALNLVSTFLSIAVPNEFQSISYLDKFLQTNTQ